MASDPQSTAKASIRDRYYALKADDGEQRTAALRAVSAKTRSLFAALHAECGAAGHQWKFDHWNFNHTCAWDKCEWCGAAEPQDQHQPQERATHG